jgi:hypothetical protein
MNRHLCPTCMPKNILNMKIRRNTAGKYWRNPENITYICTYLRTLHTHGTRLSTEVHLWAGKHVKCCRNPSLLALFIRILLRISGFVDFVHLSFRIPDDKHIPKTLRFWVLYTAVRTIWILGIQQSSLCFIRHSSTSSIHRSFVCSFIHPPTRSPTHLWHPLTNSFAQLHSHPYYRPTHPPSRLLAFTLTRWFLYDLIFSRSRQLNHQLLSHTRSLVNPFSQLVQWLIDPLTHTLHNILFKYPAALVDPVTGREGL